MLFAFVSGVKAPPFIGSPPAAHELSLPRLSDKGLRNVAMALCCGINAWRRNRTIPATTKAGRTVVLFPPTAATIPATPAHSIKSTHFGVVCGLTRARHDTKRVQVHTRTNVAIHATG
ncbi:MAG: hypothetical protein LBF89_09335 [Bacteroidales bacterium]|nr:hypothetical protein [Bacteroidales bacterium]